jgi:hypothetical protein
MKTIKQLFFMLTISLFVAGCTSNEDNTTAKGSISTQPGAIENSNAGRSIHENDTMGTENYERTGNASAHQQNDSTRNNKGRTTTSNNSNRNSN